MHDAGRRSSANLEAASGRSVGYDRAGTVTVALDASDRAFLDDLLAYQHSLGLAAHRRSASECRRLVPALSPALRGGIEVPGDHSVDNRALLAALAGACTDAGVSFVHAAVSEVVPGPGLVLSDGHRVAAEHVLLAAGTGLPSIGGLGGAGLPAVRPVKGHVLRLGPPARASAVAPGRALPRTVRGLVRGRSVYLVPRPDGSLVVGATVEERGADTTVQAGAVHELLCDARAIVPGVDELELLEVSTGLRPATADNTPCVGWTALDGVAVATGHYRNGILLAPLTAASVADLLGGRPVPPVVEALRPRGVGMTDVTEVAVTLNGEPARVAAGSTVADLVRSLLEDADPKGVAVAVDRCVIPRSEWAGTPVPPGALVEVVGAAAGG